jgi:hypothetical protein
MPDPNSADPVESPSWANYGWYRARVLAEAAELGRRPAEIERALFVLTKDVPSDNRAAVGRLRARRARSAAATPPGSDLMGAEAVIAAAAGLCRQRPFSASGFVTTGW